jgi:hypothetical protein
MVQDEVSDSHSNEYESPGILCNPVWLKLTGISEVLTGSSIMVMIHHLADGSSKHP